MTRTQLFGVRTLTQKIRDLESHLETLRRLAEPGAQRLDEPADTKSQTSRVEKLVLNIVEAANEIDALRTQLLSESAELTNKICSAILNPQVRTVILLRYVTCLDFKTIEAELDLSESTIFRLHRVGVEKLTVAR